MCDCDEVHQILLPWQSSRQIQLVQSDEMPEQREMHCDDTDCIGQSHPCTPSDDVYHCASK
jgi:hypothetical protein